MKIETVEIKTIRLSKLDRLDPITVSVENISEGEGRITIECYGQSWSAYWGGMGSRTLENFFLDCDNEYLEDVLIRGTEIKRTDIDYYEIPNHLKNILLNARRRDDIDKEPARSIYQEIENSDLSCYESILHANINIEDWKSDLPTDYTQEWKYLDRIVTAVKEAFEYEARLKLQDGEY